MSVYHHHVSNSSFTNCMKDKEVCWVGLTAVSGLQLIPESECDYVFGLFAMVRIQTLTLEDVCCEHCSLHERLLVNA